MARSACLILIVLDGTGTAWAQLPYTPLTTPLQGGSASQPPEAGGAGSASGATASGTSSESASGGTGPATVAPDASTAFTPVGSQPGTGLPKRAIEFTPRVMIRETYSDNINLAPSNRAKADFITEIVPGFDVRANGQRVKASMAYSLQGVLYGIHSSSDHVNNQVNAHVLGTVLPKHLFLSANTSYSQAVINPSAPSSATGLFATGNTTNAWVSEVNPYWLQNLGPVGNARIDYNFDRIQYSGAERGGSQSNIYNGLGSSQSNSYNGLGSSQSNSYKASLTSPSSGTGRWSWSADYRHYRDTRSGGYDTTQQEVSAELGYRIFDHLRLLADGGWEQNQQKQLYSNDFKGSYWAAGFRWKTPLNTLTFKYGHRFFGPTYDASWRHRAARVTTDLSYKETVTLVNQDLVSQALQASGSQTLPNVPLTALNSPGLYVSRRFSGSVRYSYSRTTLGLNGYDERRHYLDNQPDEHVTGATLDGTWKAGARTTVRPSVTWEHSSLANASSYTLLSPELAVSYQISQRARGEVGYRFEKRTSDTAREQYRMNEIYLQLNISF